MLAEPVQPPRQQRLDNIRSTVARRHSRAAGCQHDIDGAVADPVFERGANLRGVVAHERPRGENMPGAGDASREEVAGLVAVGAAGVRHGQDRDSQRDEGARRVQRPAAGERLFPARSVPIAVHIVYVSTERREADTPMSHDEIPNLAFIFGGTRSGKSEYAEKLLVREAGAQTAPHYIATAEPRAADSEMSERIRLHRARRGDGWRVIEESRFLPRAVADIPADAPLLVDGAALWLARMLEAGDVPPLAPKADELLNALAARTGLSVLVSDEVGQGVVADNRMAREFIDMCGQLNQRIAARAGRVLFVAAGLPLSLKPRDK